MRFHPLALGLALALLLVVIWIATRAQQASTPVSVTPRESAIPVGTDTALPVGHQGQALRTVANVSAREAEFDLESRLTRFATIELEIAAAGGSDPERERALEQLLQPTLERPAELHEILDHLVARTWRVADQSAPGLTELGAVRFLYWGILMRHTPASPIHDRAAGRKLFLALASVLPELDLELRGLLLSQVLSIEVDGRPLAALFVADLLALRAQFSDSRELYSALLAALGDGLSPAERQAFFGVLLVDESDPVLVATALRNLLQGSQPGLALALAEQLFDAEGAGADLRNAVAMAVVEGAADPFAVADFLERRAQALRNTPGAWMTLGVRAGGFVALEANYQRLFELDADPRAREMLVMGMLTSDAGDLQRVARIAFDDPDASVRGQAFLTWTSSKAYTPSTRDLLDLRLARDRGVSDFHAIVAAGNLARKANAGLRADAAVFLRELVLDAGVALRDRRAALGVLRGLVSSAEFNTLESALAAAASKY